MKKTFYVLFLLQFFFTGYLESRVTESVFNSLVKRKIIEVEHKFKLRWDRFNDGSVSFPLWNARLKTNELKNRCENLLKARWKAYFVNPEDYYKDGAIGFYKDEYQVPSKDVWRLWDSSCKYPPTVFNYNIATGSYNASVIVIRGKCFIAMEAPSNKNVDEFFNIINKYEVTHLVRLTPSLHNNIVNSFPYWEGRIDVHPITGRPTLKVNNRELNYFFTDSWKNDKGIHPKRLLAIIKSINSIDKDEKMVIGIHCRSGINRVGTLIVAYILVDEINKQIAKGVNVNNLDFSIDKIILELSLQRAFSVSNFRQYLMLYKFANYYVNSLRSE